MASACGKSKAMRSGGGAARVGDTTRTIRDTAAQPAVSDSLARAVLARHRDTLMAVPGVVGTALGLCEGEYCIKVLVEARSPIIEKRIPSELEGVRVEILPTGPIRAVGKDTEDSG